MSKDSLLKIKDKLLLLEKLNDEKVEYINGYMDALLQKKEEN